jgi:hypothetical protein
LLLSLFEEPMRPAHLQDRPVRHRWRGILRRHTLR